MPQRKPASGAWPASRWQRLAELAAARIRDLGPSAAASITFGGGTALALRHGHRISYDIDLFTTQPALIGMLTPRLNGAVEAMVMGYLEQANGLRLVLPEGEIDIVVAYDLTAPGSSPPLPSFPDFPWQTDTEILAKKILYRGHQALHRDLFDLLFMAERETAAFERAVHAAGREAAALLRATLDRLAPTLDSEMPDYVNATVEGGSYLHATASRLRDSLVVLGA